MARTRVRNLTHATVTLPTYNRVLAPGQSIVVAKARASVLTDLGGAALITNVLEVQVVPDGSAADV